MSNISEWATTAGDNNAAAPDGWPEGMSRRSVNDAAREMMAAVARMYKDQQGGLVSAGSNNAYTLTTNSSYAALNDIGLLVFRADRVNTGASTLKVDSLTAKNLVHQDGSALYRGDIRENQLVHVSYNENQDRFEYLNPPSDKVGTIKYTASANIPPGWLACNQNVSRTTYDVLFAEVGTTLGPGDGSTTFGLQMGGRVVAAREASASLLTSAIAGFNGGTLGATGGDQRGQDHTHDSGSLVGGSHSHGPGSLQAASHDHDIPARNGTSGGFDGGRVQSAVVTGTANTRSTSNSGPLNVSGNTSASSVSISGNTGNPNGSKFGGNSGNVQPTIVLNAIIKY